MEELASWTTHSCGKQANKNWKHFNTIWEELIQKIEQNNT